jgi:signal transduction histidine kinase/CheY-like chemotaxis protein
VYFVRIAPDGTPYYIIDNDPDPSTTVNPEIKFTNDSASVEAFSGKTAATDFGEYADEEYLLDLAAVVNLDDTEFFLSGYAPIFDDAGNVYCIVGVDIMSQELIEQHSTLSKTLIIQIISAIFALVTGIVSTVMYRRRTKESQAANNAKTTFLANMSHEMRTPLNAVIGMTKIGLREDSREGKDKCFSKIDVSSHFLLGIINDVLDMSKITAGKLELNPVPFRLRNTVNKVKTIIGNTAKTKGQTLSLDVRPDVPDSLIGDDQRFTQVLMNILSNAVKFTPEGGSVSLRISLLSKSEERVKLEISVTDTGIGISTEQQAHLFNVFEQADKSVARQFGGTGLGLALSKKLVEMLGGEIDVRSEPGKGSVFTFTCLFKTGSDEALTSESDEGDATNLNLKGKRILLAEDVEINREIVKALLEPTGVDIVEAADGDEAVEIFSGGGIDLILMDIQMPKVDGYEATKRIRQSGCSGAQDVPIIAMTANVFREDIEKCMAAGMNEHTGKPLDLNDVIEKLHRYIGKH